MNYQKLYECLFCAVRTAGIVANMMQATIVNEGKQVEEVEDEDERHLRMREAKPEPMKLFRKFCCSLCYRNIRLY